MKRTISFIILLTFIAVNASAQQKPSFIPQPDDIAWMEGSFLIDKKTSLSCESATLRPAADYLSGIIAKATGVTPSQKKRGGTIRLAMADNIKAGGYMLNISPKLVTITGGDYQGVVAGISTLRQMLPSTSAAEGAVAGTVTLPSCKILDTPRFAWRGMELDCSRHFFTKEEVMELLDVLALYKVNKFHWHLTDDQGWRIEIKKYPLLTERGAWRIPNDQDSVCMRNSVAQDNPDLKLPTKNINSKGEYGGFYTQDDIREIVAYARQRGIDIVPEIDIPGHSLSAINNYDGLSCKERTGWGQFFTTPLCPGKDRVLEFCKDVYREVFDLFPYHYVHVGGDEVDMSHWKECPDCQRRMRENKLKTEAELQSWFLHEMEKFFNENGRDMIGWDEIIAGGLSATSTVMWWRSWNKPALEDATRHGNHVICTPNSVFYLDYEEDAKIMGDIYHFDPTPATLNDQQKNLVLGVQGNLWTEWVPTRERMFYMAFPRMLAIAELGWSEPRNMDFDDFQRRMLPHYERLQQMGITYRRPYLKGFFATNVFIDEAFVDVTCHDPSAIIRYTTDGTIPQQSSTRYMGPFIISDNTHFIFRTFSPDGRKGQFVACDYRKEPMEAPSGVVGETPGLCCEWYDYRGPRCADIDQAPLLAALTAPEVCIPDSCRGNIGLILSGFIEVPADGIYTFALLSDDGSYLMLDGKMVVDNDGEHSPREQIGQHAMQKGLHPLLVRYFDHNGGTLKLRVMDRKGEPVNVSYWH